LAGDWSHDEGWHPKGGTFAFEVTPIEHWLELEFGVSAIRADGVTEVPIDVLFKKPWQFSGQVEVMVGIGPELIHETGPHTQTFGASPPCSTSCFGRGKTSAGIWSLAMR
jgi:hypothetical protein